MHQLACNHTSSCLDARHPCLVITGVGSVTTNQSYKFKTVWLDQQLNAILHANKQALKSIKQSVQRNKDCTGRRSLNIPIGNHGLLRDHLEGRNKIQD